MITTLLITGVLSDRIGRRKVFVVLCSLVMAAAAVPLALLHTWPSALAAAAVLGAGFGNPQLTEAEHEFTKAENSSCFSARTVDSADGGRDSENPSVT
ncbi:hypothetical protein OH786_37265 (plasmid) [Streptomyces atratus]|uniref:hypothetical protein n=1 Tax=Streptomyces atratus TaxID=1893 RepID=UPI002F90F421